MVALHKATENPTGKPVNRSLTNPISGAHQAGHGSDRSSRQLISMRKPKSGNHPLVVTTGRAASSDAAITETAGTSLDQGFGPWPIRLLDARAARTIRANPQLQPAHTPVRLWRSWC